MFRIADWFLFVTVLTPRQEFREVVTDGATNRVTFHHPGWELRPYRNGTAWFMTEPLYCVSSESAFIAQVENGSRLRVP
jgi:hypothetical protein